MYLAEMAAASILVPAAVAFVAWRLRWLRRVP
jgi:hypothetical protein